MTLCGRKRPKTVSERLGHWDISQQMFPCHLRTDSGVDPVHELFSTKPSNYFACLVSLGNWEAAQSILHGSPLKLVNLPSPSILETNPQLMPPLKRMVACVREMETWECHSHPLRKQWGWMDLQNCSCIVLNHAPNGGVDHSTIPCWDRTRSGDCGTFASTP